MKYHLFKRTITLKGKKVQRYYYWYYDENGKRVKKTTGCERKYKAEEFIEQLKTEPKVITEEVSTLYDFAKDLYVPGRCSYLKRREEKAGSDKTGKKHIPLKPISIKKRRGLLENYIFPAFGGLPLKKIDEVAIDEWLLELPLSNAYKNDILDVFRVIFREAKRKRIITAIPDLERFTRDSRRKDALNLEELYLLFPADPDELQKIWSNENYVHEPENAGLMFGTMFCLMVSSGIRPGEARAIHRDQVYPQYSGIIVNRQFDNDDNIMDPKMSNRERRRYREVIVPKRTMEMLLHWIELEDPEGLLFTFHGENVRRRYLPDRFRIGLKNAGIKAEGKRYTPHSLRYTYNTRMEDYLPKRMLQEFTGHESDQMTDYYFNPDTAHLLERLEGNQDKRELVERFW
jgi:integrase